LKKVVEGEKGLVSERKAVIREGAEEKWSPHEEERGHEYGRT